MADQPSPTASAAAPKLQVTKAAAPAYTPWACRFTKLREGVVPFIKDLKPDGNPDPAQVARVKAHLLATIESLPADANAVEFVIEANNTGAADQTNVIVWPKKL